MKFKTIIAAVMTLVLTAGTFSANSAFSTVASAAQATHAISRFHFQGSGTASSSHTQAAAGTTVTLTVTANEGYVVNRFTLDTDSGKSLINDTPCSKSKTYTFIMPDEGVYYSAIFTAPVNRSYYIYHTNHTGSGNVSVDKSGALNPGDLVTVTATPREGYKVGNVLVQYHNSQSYTPGQPKYSQTVTIPGQPNQTAYTFSMPGNDIDICVNFVEDSAPTPTPDPTPTPTPTPTWKKGDVNLDGNVDVRDATLVLKHIAKLIILTGQEGINADVNNDGYINAKDATEILKIVAGIA